MTATGGQEALKLFKEQKVDILVIDYFMPEMSGGEVIEKIRDFRKYVYIILNTGYSDKLPAYETIEEYKIQGYNDKNKGSAYLLLSILSGKISVELHNKLLEQIKLTLTDSLTNIYNRLYFDDLIKQEVERSNRCSVNLSLAVIDIDNFKKINDTYGHDVGDAVIKNIAGILTNKVRCIDTVCRYGGDEFVVVMPETTLENAQILAERLRRSVEETSINTKQGELKCTISVGISEFRGGEEILFKDADKKLYEAKKNGRNMVAL